MNAETRTIVDIGGQDSKAIKADPENGNVLDFIMNDKCAAGTGRFLEKVAQLLDLSLKDLATARRIKSLLRRVGFEQDIVFTGGVSQNPGMVKALEETIGSPITKTALDPTFAGALGAAVSAGEAAEGLLKSYGGEL